MNLERTRGWFMAADKRLGRITAADLRGDSLLLLSSNMVHLGVGFGSKFLSEMTWKSYEVGFSQKEAVSFGTKSTDIFISDELNTIGNNLYYRNISTTTSIEKLQANKFDVHQTSSFLCISLKTRKLAHIYVFIIFRQAMYSAPFDKNLTIAKNDFPPGTYINKLILGEESYDFKWAKRK